MPETAAPTPAHDPVDEIHSESQLFAPFEAAFRSPSDRIGLEAEKFGVRADGTPLRYHGPGGVTALFAELVARFGWRPEGEQPGGAPIALVRGQASITLEPGSQLELSGTPFDSVHEILAEVNQHRAELAALESARDLHWVALGFHPFARLADLDWVPKARYATMRDYLPTRGAMGPDMMRRTATVQANFDIHSERDAMDKLRAALALAPVVQALFANSAVYEDVRHTAKSHRAEVWLDVDPDRAGLLPFAWRPDAALGDYITWALDVPMFIIKRHHAAIRCTHLTFRAFLRDGVAGHRATLADWEMHLNTLFPEVRLKRTLEVRSADGVPAAYSAALPALWAGILYDPAALAAAADAVVPLGLEAWTAARLQQIAREALGARVAGLPLQDIARRVLAVASEGLARRARLDAAGRDERVYLEPLAELVADGRCIGDAILADYPRPGDDPAAARAQLIARGQY